MSTIGGIKVASKWGSFAIGILTIILLGLVSFAFTILKFSIPFFGLILIIIIWATCVYRKGDTLYYLVGLFVGVVVAAIVAVILGLALLGLLVLGAG